MEESDSVNGKSIKMTLFDKVIMQIIDNLSTCSNIEVMVSV